MIMKGYIWIPFLLFIFSTAHAQPVLDLAHVKPDSDKGYVVAELSGIGSDSALFVFSCRPKTKISDYHKVKVHRHKAQTQSSIFCQKYIYVKAIAGHSTLTDSLNVGLIREIIGVSKTIAEK